jgi:crotonobetainyl-CoA:carnitine CoA-transferase CaiB-like acyl-CoA transferase
VIAARIREETAATWLRLCADEDVCLSLVRDVSEAIDATALESVRAFTGGATPDRMEAPDLPLPLDPRLRIASARRAPVPDRVGDRDWPST